MPEGENVTVFGDIADKFDALVAYDEKLLDNWVETEGYSLESMAVASGAKALMSFAKGFVDVGRIGNGLLVEGGIKGVGKDLLRTLNLAGGVGAAIGRGTSLLRSVQGIGQGSCTWVAATNAARFSGQRYFLTVSELAKRAGVSLSQTRGTYLTDFQKMVAALQAMKIPVRELAKSGARMSMSDVFNLVRANPGGVVVFGISGPRTTHALYATWSRVGGFFIRDPARPFAIYRSLAAVEKAFRPGIRPDHYPILYIPNTLMTNLAGLAETVGTFSGLESLVVQLMPVINVPARDGETATQALIVREALASEKASLSGKYHPVADGDWLSKLAQRHYGNMHKWPVIFAANRALIGQNPDLIRPGQRLFIPDLPPVRLIAASSLPEGSRKAA